MKSGNAFALAILGTIIVVMFVQLTNHSAAPPTPTPTVIVATATAVPPTPTVIPPTPTPASPQEAIRAAVLQTSLYGKVDTLTVNAAANQSNVWDVSVHEQIGEGFTAQGTAQGALNDFAQICKSAYQSGQRINQVSWTGSYPLTDQYGNNTVSDVISATLPSSQGDRINWVRLGWQGVWKLATVNQVAPAFAVALAGGS